MGGGSELSVSGLLGSEDRFELAIVFLLKSKLPAPDMPPGKMKAAEYCDLHTDTKVRRSSRHTAMNELWHN